MTANLDSVRNELFAYETSDPVVESTLVNAWGLLTESEAAASLDELHLCLLNPSVASAELKGSRYFTQSCQALRDEKLIVVNERFLLDLEAAIRSFAQSESLLGSPYLKSDAHLFGLVQMIQSDTGPYLARLRRHAQRLTAEANADLMQELVLVTLFFLGHELGHFMNGHPAGQFAAFLDPSKPLEERIEDAVVKLCRHVDEFRMAGFPLPDFERIADVADASSDVRHVAMEYRARDERRYERLGVFFTNEVEADDWSNRTVIAHLETIAKSDPVKSDRSFYLLARGVFVAALYTWYQDLSVFGRKLCEPMNDSRYLDLIMVQSWEHYVHVASLFGELHRFTLLRAALTFEAVMRARRIDLPLNRSIWCKHGAAAIAANPEIRREWWLAESLQRYCLLGICIDTAVKFAHVGCATGWFIDPDRKRGSPPQLLMHFESISQAVGRLKSVP